MDAALIAALGSQQPTVFGAIEIALAGGGFVRLLDGAGEISFAGATFRGSDPVFGTLASFDGIADRIGDEAPEATVVLYPASDAAALTLASPAMQGQSVKAWLGAVDPATGLTIGAPEPMFTGVIDVAAISVGAGGRRLELSVVSGFEWFFDVDEGIRLNDPWHQGVWPGELGCAFVTVVEQNIYWGGERPPAAITRGYSSFDQLHPRGADGRFVNR